jgi:hypothetical protein
VLAHKIRNVIAFVRLSILGPDESRIRLRSDDGGEWEKARDSYMYR